jgi:hypothetical protein
VGAGYFDSGCSRDVLLRFMPPGMREVARKSFEVSMFCLVQFNEVYQSISLA